MRGIWKYPPIFQYSSILPKQDSRSQTEQNPKEKPNEPQGQKVQVPTRGMVRESSRKLKPHPNQANERVLQDLEKYINLHHHYFGKYEFGVCWTYFWLSETLRFQNYFQLMQRPDSHTLKHLDMTIYEFLKKHSIESITSLFFSLFHTTGYG